MNQPPQVTGRDRRPPALAALADVPAALADVALIDAKTAAAAGGMGVSWWQEEVRTGRAPQPVIREVRCTRWRLADVREFWRERGSRKADAAGAARLRERATNASKAAQVKRRAMREMEAA